MPQKKIDEILGKLFSHGYDTQDNYYPDEAKQALASHLLGLPSLQYIEYEFVEKQDEEMPILKWNECTNCGSDKHDCLCWLLNAERKQIRQEIAEALGVKEDNK